MDKNTVIVFLLLLFVIILFNSPTWRKMEEKMGWRKPPTAVDSARVQADTVLEDYEKTPFVPAISGEDTAGLDSTAEPDGHFAEADSDRIVENEIVVVSTKYIGTLSNRGAKITSWKLASWARDSSDLELIPQNTGGALGLKIKNQETGDSLWECSSKQDNLFIEGRGSVELRYSYGPSGPGGIIKTFIFHENRYDFDMEIKNISKKEDEFELCWDAGIRESEDQRMSYMQNPEIIFGMQEGISKKSNIKEGKKQEEKGYADYVALKSRYFFSALTIEKINRAQNVIIRGEHADTMHSNSAKNIRYSILTNFDDGLSSHKIVIAPADYGIARSYERNMGHIIFSGWRWFFRADTWFPPLCQVVLYLLKKFYNLIPNYGISILLLTILFRAVTFPLTLKSSRSMARMKDLQPKMTEIREKFKSDPMKQQQLIMKLYKEEGVNPLGAGCLPQFLQMPIFFSLYIALRKAIELRGAGFALWITDLSGPEYIPLITLPFSLPFYGNRISSLAIFMAVTMYISTKQTITDPRQKGMVYIMPVMMLVMLNQMPAGLLLYWAVSNVLGIFQNKLMAKAKNAARSASQGQEVTAAPIPPTKKKAKKKKKPLFSLPKPRKKGGITRWK
jgi:YidC/Oxa1 family membrane protein insertase